MRQALPRPMEMRFHGAHRQAQRLGDLDQRRLVAMESQDDVPLDRLESCELLLELLAGSEVGGSWRWDLVDEIAEPLRIIRPSPLIDPDPASDLPQPAADGLRRIVGVPVSPGPRESILKDVFGLGTSERAQPRSQGRHLGDQTA